MGIVLNFLPREFAGFQLVCNKWSLGLYQAVTFNQVKTALEICFSVNERRITKRKIKQKENLYLKKKQHLK